MIQTTTLLPGVTLRCFADARFKQGCLSLQLVRPMCAEEAALNALLPAVLLRGCRSCPDLRSITMRLDDLYGASVGTLVRRVGDYQTTGLYCSFIDDRYTLAGDRVLAPMTDFLRQLLLLFPGKTPVQILHRHDPHGNALLLDHLENRECHLLDLLIRNVHMHSQTVLRQALRNAVERSGRHANIA